MIETWSPVALAKLSLMVLFIPAGLTILAVIFSIILGLIADLTGVDKESPIGITLDKMAGNIFYIAFLSVIVMNITAVGLIASGIWAVLQFLSDLLT